MQTDVDVQRADVYGLIDWLKTTPDIGTDLTPYIPPPHPPPPPPPTLPLSLDVVVVLNSTSLLSTLEVEEGERFYRASLGNISLVKDNVVILSNIEGVIHIVILDETREPHLYKYVVNLAIDWSTTWSSPKGDFVVGAVKGGDYFHLSETGVQCLTTTPRERQADMETQRQEKEDMGQVLPLVVALIAESTKHPVGINPDIPDKEVNFPDSVDCRMKVVLDDTATWYNAQSVCVREGGSETGCSRYRLKIPGLLQVGDDEIIILVRYKQHIHDDDLFVFVLTHMDQRGDPYRAQVGWNNDLYKDVSTFLKERTLQNQYVYENDDASLFLIGGDKVGEEGTVLLGTYSMYVLGLYGNLRLKDHFLSPPVVVVGQEEEEDRDEGGGGGPSRKREREDKDKGPVCDEEEIVTLQSLRRMIAKIGDDVAEIRTMVENKT